MSFEKNEALPDDAEIPGFIRLKPKGFPSPANDYHESGIDLNKLLVGKAVSTYFLKVEGDSMVDAHIYDGDLLIVDSSKIAEHGDVVIAAVDGEYKVRNLVKHPRVSLVAMNPKYPPIDITEATPLHIFGVVTYIISPAQSRRYVRPL
ncbi:translesion error-prone DNA polymerase V autoproteolytic subunit [Pantoea sp. LMR881]|uniref:translesion error-prone DNA polymerase V autoproteolytic subunit n=1 Tax=Pantoea sp. LMR881 TaxID=3014336 RepID=UPI0022AF88E6|nr:translesion error-prone DNA polymerase V autoproteolytic subunit [Pantoea sp. LMR881]MCZ4061246.1 translesion error-prone DNA polymerase V autoproteolytic subunit [Pantoea sp. LMR881]